MPHNWKRLDKPSKIEEPIDNWAQAIYEQQASIEVCRKIATVVAQLKATVKKAGHSLPMPKY